MLNEKVIKVLGIAATAVGLGASILSGWVNEKKIDEKITEKVAKAIIDQTKGGS